MPTRSEYDRTVGATFSETIDSHGMFLFGRKREANIYLYYMCSCVSYGVLKNYLILLQVKTINICNLNFT